MQDIETLIAGRPVAVVGAGLVGAGWAVVYARAGLQVRLFDSNPEITRHAPALIEAQLRNLNATA